MTPERAARLLLSHTLRTSDGPLLFSPTAANPFASDFADGARFPTAVVNGGVTVRARGERTGTGDGWEGMAEWEGRRARSAGGVNVGVKVVEKSTRSTATGGVDVADEEVFVDGAR